jgi:hypothetical protein
MHGVGGLACKAGLVAAQLAQFPILLVCFGVRCLNGALQGVAPGAGCSQIGQDEGAFALNIFERGARLQPIEIKSGQTFHTGFLDGLNKWARYAGDSALEPTLVYGGDTPMTRSGVAVRPWRDMLPQAA